MNANTFLRLVEGLTGTPVKDVTESDRACLDAVLADDQRTIDCSQLNELLLLVNKDRVSPTFVTKYFGEDCRVGTLVTGIHAFQKLALLRYGNFIYAFRTLSRISSSEDLQKELGECARTTEELTESFSGRSPKLLDTTLIAKADTPLVGYLSATEIVAEHGRAQLLQMCLPLAAQLPGTTWDEYEARVIAAADSPRIPLSWPRKPCSVCW